MSEVRMLQLLQGFLETTSQRQQLTISNMANIDTPGYRTRDLDFSSAMHRALKGLPPTVSASAKEIPDLPERPDGNNVDLDRESLVLSQTQLQYQVGVQLVKSEFHKLYSAMKD